MNPIVRGPTVSLTDLLRAPNEVLPRLNVGPVTVKRRGGDDFCLVQLRQWEALSSTGFAVANAFGEMLAECECRPNRRRDDAAIPWLSFLDTRDQDECLRDVLDALRVSLETGRLSVLVDTLSEWRATALATWDERRTKGRPGYQVDEPVPLEKNR